MKRLQFVFGSKLKATGNRGYFPFFNKNLVMLLAFIFINFFLVSNSKIGDSTILCKIIRKFPTQSLLFFPKFLHLQDSAVLSSLIRFTALSEKQLSGVFELFENQILTNGQGRVSSAQLEVAFLLARRSVKNEERVRRLLKSETTKEQFQQFQKNLDESDSADLIALQELSLSTSVSESSEAI